MNDTREERTMNLITLPFEILEKIGDNLDHKSSLNLRLTCNVLKQLIDTYVGVHVKFIGNLSQIHTSDEQLNFIREICLSKVTTTNIFGDESKAGLVCYFNEDYLIEDIFCFPHFLRTIKLSGLAHAKILRQLLRKCFNLEEIFLEEGFQLEGDLWPFLMKEEHQKAFNVTLKEKSKWLSMFSQEEDIFHRIFFRRLRRISFVFFNKDENGSDLLNALTLLKCIQSEVLSRIALNLSQIKVLTEMDYFHISNIITDFMRDHSETLNDFSFYINPTSGSDAAPSKSDFEAFLLQTYNVKATSNKIKDKSEDLMQQKIKMMVNLRQKLDIFGKTSKLTYLNISILPHFHWDFWLVLIENCHKLITLRIVGSTKYSILHNCDFIKNSSKTLKRFRMTLDIVKTFDLSGIQECDNLEEFFLFNRPKVFRPFSAFNHATSHLKNIHLIPPGLKALCLGDVVLPSQDINEMLSKQKNLDTLVIVNIWSYDPNNGADCDCVKKIFHMRSLHSTLIYGFNCNYEHHFKSLLELLDFTLIDDTKEYIRNMQALMEYTPAVALFLSLDIVSTDVFLRYIWEREAENLDFYCVRYNELDPYL